MESSEEDPVDQIERKLSTTVKNGNSDQLLKLLQQLDPQQRNSILTKTSKPDLNQKNLLDAAMERLNEAEKQELSTINKDRVKGALLSAGLGIVAIYNIVVAFKVANSSSSTGNSTDESSSDTSIDYSEAIPSLIGSLYLIWSSGKEIWKVGKNHYAQRNKEKAHSMLHVIKESSTPPNTPTSSHKAVAVAKTTYALNRISLQNQNEIRANKETIAELTQRVTELTEMIQKQPNPQLELSRDTLQKLLNTATLERKKRKAKKIAEVPVEEESEEYSQSNPKTATKHFISPSSSSEELENSDEIEPSSDYSDEIKQPRKKERKVRRRSPKVSPDHSSEAEEE
jgi:hypothetical protein